MAQMWARVVDLLFFLLSLLLPVKYRLIVIAYLSTVSFMVIISRSLLDRSVVIDSEASKIAPLDVRG